MKEIEKEAHIISYTTCILVWIALILLLGATITISRTHLFIHYSVLAALFIASAKTGLVLMYFMHLKYEGKFLKGMLFMVISVLTLIIAFTFMDIWYR